MSKVVKGVGKAVGGVAKAAVSVVKKVAPVALPVIGIATGNPWLAAAGSSLGAAAGGASLGNSLLAGGLGYVGGAVANAGGLSNFANNGLAGGLANVGTSMMNPGSISSAFGNIGSSLSGVFGGNASSANAALDSSGGVVNNGNFGLNSQTGLYDVPGSFNASGAFIPSGAGSMFDQAGKLLTGSALSNSLSGLASTAGLSGLLSTGLNAVGGYLSSQQAADAAKTSADAQIKAAQIAADAAKFRPVGVTTNFGSSKFGFDANGNLSSAGYTLSPELQAQQNQLMATAPGLLSQFTNSKATTAPMGTAASSMMNLGNQYLTTSPQAQAAKYMAEQQALLAPSNQRDMADLQARLLSQGRLGVATGATTDGMNAANPELEAYYNALNMQNRNLAANATQGGMDYAKFGSGMVGSGGDMLNGMYQTQANSYTPYNTAVGGAQMLEGLGQNALTMGMNMGNTATAANANSGQLLASGINNAAQTMQPANAQSNWGTFLSGAGNSLANYTANNNNQQNQLNMMTAYLQGIDSPLNKWSNA